jgi:hypothetical protein
LNSESHFDGEDLRAISDDWEGYAVVCIPNVALSEVDLDGFDVSSVSKALSFELKQCTNNTLNEGDLPCHD